MAPSPKFFVVPRYLLEGMDRICEINESLLNQPSFKVMVRRLGLEANGSFLSKCNQA